MMKFAFRQEDEAFRQEILQFIAEHVTSEVLAEQEEEGPVGPHAQALLEKMRERGWIRLALPKEYGGQGGDLVRQFIVDEEFTRAGVVTGHNYGSGFGTIIMAGTEEQKRYFLPRILSGEVSFALGYTEPSGGADLASLRTTARRDGDEYVINGQKMFTGGATHSTHIYLLVRTDPNAPKHAGISVLLVPLDTPGITVRPLRLLKDKPLVGAYGGPWSNEVFFEDVRVPATALLGKENEGWRLASAGLSIDRIGVTRYLRCVRRTDDIISFLKSNSFDGYAPLEDPTIRDRLADLWIERQAYRLMTMRSLQMIKRNVPMTYESAAEKVWGPDHGVKAIETIAQILGPYMQLLSGTEYAPNNGEFGDHLLSAWLVGVAHGSVQVMRDQMSRRGLGLPRG
jgi:alkylation response protein AidB-like acyl-CoA dehydrogenase